MEKQKRLEYVMGSVVKYPVGKVSVLWCIYLLTHTEVDIALVSIGGRVSNTSRGQR